MAYCRSLDELSPLGEDAIPAAANLSRDAGEGHHEQMHLLKPSEKCSIEFLSGKFAGEGIGTMLAWARPLKHAHYVGETLSFERESFDLNAIDKTTGQKISLT